MAGGHRLGRVTSSFGVARGALCACLVVGLLLAAGAAQARVDRAAPRIQLLEPANGTRTADALTVFRFEIEEPGVIPGFQSGIDRHSRVVRVNGEDRTAQTVFIYTDLPWPWTWLDEHLADFLLYDRVRTYLPWYRRPTKGMVVFTPTQAVPLPQGSVQLEFEIADLAGNRASFTAGVEVDSVAPVVEARSPAAGSLINQASLALTYGIVETGAGIDPQTLAVTVNGLDSTSRAVLAGDQITLTPPSGGWVEGPLVVDLVVADQVGNRTTARFEYSVAVATLAARPRAVPAEGDAPLRVRFFPEASSDTAIEQYSWDFDGDGRIDRNEVIGTHQDWTFNQPGEYRAALTVRDSRGETATGHVTVHVHNAPPVVSASANPSNGEIPLTVTFEVTATDNEGIALYEWDYDGDGIVDYSGPRTTFRHTYDREGVYRPTLRVVDVLGAATTYNEPIVIVRAAPAGSPSVAGSASPASGNGPLTVTFSATATHPDGEAVTGWAWDFDGDGNFDYEGTSPNVQHTYNAPGTYYPTVRVTTADGKSAEDAVQVVVRMQTSLTVSRDTIDTGLEETSVVRTTLGAATRASIIIESRQGHLVRTLVPWTDRAAGAYQDAWDGRDDGGRVVPEGVYHAVLRYEEGGQVRRLDLSLSTGGVQSNPPRSSIPRRFQPFNDDPLRITFTLNRASEVTAFMGRYNVNTRLMTFMQRHPLGRGSHTIVWYGTDTDGRLIHPPANDYFLFGIFAFTLPDNAIYVRSGAHVSNVRSEQPVFGPGAAPELPLHFQLSQPADIELTVTDADTGKTVLERTYTGFGAGANTLYWDAQVEPGVFAAPGRYRIGLTAVDPLGFRSLTVYTIQRIYY